MHPDSLKKLQEKSKKRNLPRLEVEKERIAKVVKMPVKKVVPPPRKRKQKPVPKIDWEKIKRFAKSYQ